MNAFSQTSASASLSQRAMLMSLKISQWSGRRLDREITEEVNQQHKASADAGRYNKSLLDKDALKEINQIISETRQGFLDRTLPWMNDGTRIIAADAYMNNAMWFSNQQTKFSAAVDDFLMKYNGHVQDARARLAGMFKDDDYPDVDTLRQRFAMEVKVMPVPSSGDFRVDIAEDQAILLREEIERNVMEASTAAVKSVYRRIADVTERMATKLREYKPAKGKGSRAEGVFRDSLVENIRDLINVMPGLNITGDPNLTKISDELQGLVRFDVEYLRSDEDARQNMADEAQAIFDTVSEFLG